MLFNKKHGIKTDTEHLNISTSEDSEMFLDPSLVYHYRRKDFPNNLHQRSKAFFGTLLDNYVIPKKEEEGVNFLLHLHEPKEYCIGYSNEGKSGKAIGKEKALSIYEAFQKHSFTQSSLTILSDPFSVLLMIEGIGQDNFSDIILNVARDLFCEFTESICLKYAVDTSKFEIEYFNQETLTWQKRYFQLPYDEEGNMLILIPKWLLKGRKDFLSAFNRHVCKRYIWKELLENNDLKKLPESYYRETKKGVFPNVKAILKDYRKDKADFWSFVVKYNSSIQTFLDQLCLDYPDLEESSLN